MTTFTPLTCAGDIALLLSKRGPMSFRDIASELPRYRKSTLQSTLSKDPLFSWAHSPDHAGVRVWSVPPSTPHKPKAKAKPRAKAKAKAGAGRKRGGKSSKS